MAMQSQAIQAQQQMQSQQMAAQAAMQKLQMESQAQMQINQAELQSKLNLREQEAQLKLMLMEREFEMNLQLRGMEASQLAGREQSREDAKSKRISQQNTEQSKLINQRKNNLPPMNFESNEDSLDGFDLAEFAPR
jgi:hypothetical protein